MATGIAGDNTSISTILGQNSENAILVELRTMNAMLLTLLGQNQASDELSTLRNDQALALGLPVPYIAAAT